jgi:aspartyl-tRNA(Asn)/glutamyl-tRNA(Gln) amidotransferase subunit B
MDLLNWMKGPIQSVIKERGQSISEFNLSPAQIGELAALTSGPVSFSVAAQKILPRLIENPNDTPKSVAQRLGLLEQQDHNSLEPMILEILKAFPEKVTAYKNGKKGLLGFFMGQLMKKTDSRVDPKKANELLTKHLK